MITSVASISSSIGATFTLLISPSRIAKDENKPEPFRILDRRLQALRKSGKIRSTSKGWVRA
ncbi:hypothetical protein DMS21_10015 [Klebsiella variicola]|nr:hypothetical protein DMS21_10015 [Klebsiella variicola]